MLEPYIVLIHPTSLKAMINGHNGGSSRTKVKYCIDDQAKEISFLVQNFFHTFKAYKGNIV